MGLGPHESVAPGAAQADIRSGMRCGGAHKKENTPHRPGAGKADEEGECPHGECGKLLPGGSGLYEAFDFVEVFVFARNEVIDGVADLEVGHQARVLGGGAVEDEPIGREYEFDTRLGQGEPGEYPAVVAVVSAPGLAAYQHHLAVLF